MLFGICIFGFSHFCFAAKFDCPLDRADDTAKVTFVFDGDTIQLQDGRRIRFIAMNAPERKNRHSEKLAEPFADESFHALTQLLSNSDNVLLKFESQRHDSYGRTLAHVFRSDGLNLQAELIKNGLGAHIAIPPDIWQYDCYASLQDAAYANRKAMWSTKRFSTIPVTKLANQSKGFYRISVDVEKVEQFFGNFYLRDNRGNGFRIDQKYLPWFGTADFSAWVGRTLEAQGWIYSGKRGITMRVYHPIMFKVNDTKVIEP